ncbi:AraC family transcriptional regulator [Rhizobium sp. SG2393]|uniref:AraC family transcriptional regulator n=1 Tax=Rhizobium sp. SG2393 TaxID=3276279 RepID=UPI0036714813
MIDDQSLRTTATCRVDTRDLDVARKAVGEIFCPHFLTAEKSSLDRFHARHHVSTGQGYSANLVSYGAAVEIDPGELSRFFLLQIPTRGAAEVRCGGTDVESAALTSASLLSPTLSTRMRWEEGCEQLILLVERAPVEHFVETMTHGAGGPVEFDPRIDLTTPVGRGLVHHASLMVAATLPGAGFAPAYMAMLRDGLTSLLLTGFRHNRMDALARPQADSGPAAVRRADDFIRDHAADAITAGDIAAAAGVPLRTLQESFRKARGMTLIEALQAVRLEKLRAALLAGGPETSVSDAVFAAGLGHLGRAAAAYRDRYGESPLQTLRRARG